MKFKKVPGGVVFFAPQCKGRQETFKEVFD